MDIRTFLAAHDGIITIAEARACGMSSAPANRRVARGEWVRVVLGVYRSAAHPETDRTRVRAAVASVGKAATLSGVSAAWWLGLIDRLPATLSVTTPAKGHHRTVGSDVDIHCRRLHECDVVVVDGLRVTAPALTALEAAAVQGVRVLDNALLRKRVTLDQLDAAHARYPRRRGAPWARQTLAAMRNGTRSEAERIVAEVFRDADITGWIANFEIHGHPWDFVFEESELIVEIDGFAYHRDSEVFQRDRTKRNVLTGNGWRALHFTWDDITLRPMKVAAEVRHALKRPAA